MGAPSLDPSLCVVIVSSLTLGDITKVCASPQHALGNAAVVVAALLRGNSQQALLLAAITVAAFLNQTPATATRYA